MKSAIDEEKHQRRLGSSRKPAFKSRYRKKVLIEQLQKKEHQSLLQTESVRRQNDSIHKIISGLTSATKVPKDIEKAEIARNNETEQSIGYNNILTPAINTPNLVPSSLTSPLIPSMNIYSNFEETNNPNPSEISNPVVN